MTYLIAAVAALAASPALAHHAAQDASHTSLGVVLLCGAASVAFLALKALRRL